MGMGNVNQVYFDPISNQYYTMGMNNQAAYGRNIIGGAYNQQPVKQKSPINELLAQSLAAKANAPGLAQLFPGMVAPTMGGSQGMPIGLLGQGQYGAGRFLGGNAMGNQSNQVMPQQPAAPTQPSQPVTNPTVRNIQNPASNMTLEQYIAYAQTAPTYKPQRMSAQQATAMGIPLYDGKGPMMNAFGQPMTMGGFNFSDNSLQAQKNSVMSQAAAQRAVL